MSSHSGRDVNKVEMSGLPVAMGESITYKEANLTFSVKDLPAPFAKESLATDIQEYYQTNTSHFQRMNMANGNRTGCSSARLST